MTGYVSDLEPPVLFTLSEKNQTRVTYEQKNQNQVTFNHKALESHKRTAKLSGTSVGACSQWLRAAERKLKAAAGHIDKGKKTFWRKVLRADGT